MFLVCGSGQQENLYNDNLEASVAVLKKLIEEWKELSVKLTPADILTLNRTMKSLRQKVPCFMSLCQIIHYPFTVNTDSDPTMFY